MTSPDARPALADPIGRDDHEPLLIGACCAALATLLPVAAYQLGAIDRLPDPPGRIFNSEKIARSKTAHPLGIPDACLGIASYATTLTLALLAPRYRKAGLLLGAKLTADTALAAFNATRQIAGFARLCSWCTGTAIATGVMAWGGRRAIRASLRQAASLLKPQPQLIDSAHRAMFDQPSAEPFATATDVALH